MTSPLVNVVVIILTLMVLSRVAGDNPLYRMAQYIFVGTSLGIALVVTYHQVLRPALASLLIADPQTLWLTGVPILLGLLLLTRISTRQQVSWLANIPLAIIFGVGAALAIGGAIAGTLAPQMIDTARPLIGGPAQIIGVVVLMLGTIATLSAFFYTVPPDHRYASAIRRTGIVGRWLLMIAFGFFFAGAIQTYLSALIGRLNELILFVRSLIG